MYSPQMKFAILYALMLMSTIASAQADFEWYASYNNVTFSSFGYPKDIVLDNEGNVVACGYTAINDTSQSLMAIIKLSPAGDQLWNFNMTLSDEYPALVTALDVNSNNEILFTGETGDTVIVGKLNPDGLLQWIEKYAINKYWNHGRDIHVTATDEILVSGDCSNDTVVLLKYTNDGDLLWERFRQRQFYFGFVYTAFDSESNTYQCYEVPGTDEYTDFEVCKYNAEGDLMWAHAYSNFSLTAFARDFAISDDGCAYVLNRAYGNSQLYELVKIDSVGDLAWSAYLDNFPDQNYFTYATDIAVDKDKNVMVIGEQYDSDLLVDYKNIVKFNDDGAYVWQKGVDYIANTVSYGSDIFTDNYGNIYSMFNYGDTIPWSSTYMMINKRGPSGDLKWSATFSENCYPEQLLVNEDEVYALITGPGDNLYDAIGVIKYSQVVTMQSQAPQTIAMQAYPNPAIDYIQFMANANVELMHAETYNIAGELVDVNIKLNTPCDVGMLPAGYYTSRCITSLGTATIAWVKQ